MPIVHLFDVTFGLQRKKSCKGEGMPSVPIIHLFGGSVSRNLKKELLRRGNADHLFVQPVGLWKLKKSWKGKGVLMVHSVSWLVAKKLQDLIQLGSLLLLLAETLGIAFSQFSKFSCTAWEH